MRLQTVTRLALVALVAVLCTQVVTAAPYPDIAWCDRQNLFFWNQTAEDAPDGYLAMDNVPQPAEQNITTITISVGDGVVPIANYISPIGEPGTALIIPDLWRFRTYAGVTSDPGETQIIYQVWNRTIDGTETEIFYEDSISHDVNGGGPTEYDLNYARRNYTVLSPTDRLVVKVFAQTSHASPIDVDYYTAGTNYASMVSMGDINCPSGDVYDDTPIIFGTLGLLTGVFIIMKFRKG